MGTKNPVEPRGTNGPIRPYAAQLRPKSRTEEVLSHFDATSFVGLKVIVHDSAVKRVDIRGRSTIEVPNLRQLSASAAIARCLMPIRLQGSEIKIMRRLLGLTLAELAKAMDVRTALETVSRWESEAQPMGGFAEKLLRLLVCERLLREAPGVDYHASKIAELQVVDPWKSDSTFEIPSIEFHLVKMRSDGDLVDAWNNIAA